MAKTKKTPLIVASKRGDTEMVELLLSHKANPKKQDKQGNTAAAYAKGEALRARLLEAEGASRASSTVGVAKGGGASTSSTADKAKDGSPEPGTADPAGRTGGGIQREREGAHNSEEEPPPKKQRRE